MEMTGEVLENLSALVESGQRGMVMNVVADLYPADLALLLEHLSADEAGILFHWLPTERAGEVLPELDDDFRAALLEEVHSERITEIIDELDTDDAADVLADLPHGRCFLLSKTRWSSKSSCHTMRRVPAGSWAPSSWPCPATGPSATPLKKSVARPMMSSPYMPSLFWTPSGG
jgi:hypothetical protein